MTTGICLPGTYQLLYNGPNDSKGTLTILIERLSTVIFDYAFIFNGTNVSEATRFVASLNSGNNLTATDTTWAEAGVAGADTPQGYNELLSLAQSQLPAFGVDPSAIRLVKLSGTVDPPEQISAGSGAGDAVLLIHLRYTAVLGTTELPTTITDQQQASSHRRTRRLAADSRLVPEEGGVDAPVSGRVPLGSWVTSAVESFPKRLQHIVKRLVEEISGHLVMSTAGCNR